VKTLTLMLMEGVVFVTFSFWLLVVTLVLHSMGWTGGYILIVGSFFSLAAGTERLIRWSIRE